MLAASCVLGVSAACTDMGPRATLPSDAPAAALAGREATQDTPLFNVLDSADLTEPGARRRLRSAAARAWAADVQVVRIAANAGALLQQGRAVALDIGRGTRFVAVGDTAIRRDNGLTSWWGRLHSPGFGSVNLVLSPGGVTGTLRVGTAAYAVEPLGGGLHTVTRVDPRYVKPDHRPDDPLGADSVTTAPPADSTVAAPTREAGASDLANMTAAPMAGTSQDNGAPYQKVLVVYTPASVSYVANGDVAGAVQAAVDEANISYRNSYVHTTLYLASTEQVSYSEAGWSDAQMVGHLQGTSDGYIDNVHARRNQLRADLVVMIVAPLPGNCGRASVIRATTGTAFAIVGADCLPQGELTFAHEVGHLQGGAHEDGAGAAFPYGRGYVAPNNAWKTIMATRGACGGACPRLAYWSNPDVTYADGQAMGNAATAHDARVLNGTSYTIRDFRAPATPGYFQQVNYSIGQYPRFSWPTVPGPANYTVYRCEPANGGFCGTVSVAYTNNGSTFSVEDLMRRISGSCARTARYYVVAADYIDGTSPPSFQQHTLCVQ